MNNSAHLGQILAFSLLLGTSTSIFAVDPFSGFFDQAEQATPSGISMQPSSQSNSYQQPQSELVEMALQQNAQESLAEISLQQAEADKTLNESALNTQVLWETDAGYNYIEQRDRDLNVDNNLKNGVLQTKISLDKTLWDKSLTLGVATAKKHIKTAQLNVLSEQEDVRASALLAELAFQQAKATLAISRKRIQQLQSLLTRTKHRQQLGYAAEIDIVEAQTSLDRATTQLITEQAQVDATRITLLDITGSDTVTQSHNVTTYSPTAHNRAIQTLPVILKNVFNNNPKLKSLQADLAAQHYNLRQANAGTAPKLKLLSELEQTWSEGDTDGSQTDFVIGLNLTKPLYTGGRQAAQVELAKQQGHLSERRYIALKRQLTQTVQLAVAEYKSSLSTYQSLQRLNQQLEKQANFMNAGIKFGSKTDTDLIATLNSKIDVEKSLVQQHYNLLKIKVQLASLQGVLGEQSPY